MKNSTPPDRGEIVSFLKALRDEIIANFETMEVTHRFQRTPWNHKSGGGGEISLIRGGEHFEKAAVNWSGVSGDTFPMQDGSGPFFATGVSLITHMRSPHLPTVHMNIRYIETAEQFWFGGGYDMTPMGACYEEDRHHFHAVARRALTPYGVDLYDRFSEAARQYFFIPHRNKERGVGGIFFDHYNTGDLNRDLSLWKQVGSTFLDAIMPIYRKRKSTPYTEDEINRQLELRAHYVEFNLLYDRGTKFGFMSGGNPDAILCSMPPRCGW